MSKRFVDTGMFDDPYFMDLSLEAKIFFIFFITNCDHAGVLKLNKRLCQFKTGINDLDTVIKELSNRLVIVSEELLFMPKFILFQYPKWPNSKVKQQMSAIDILKKLNIDINTLVRVNKGLKNTYDNENDNGIVNENDNEVNKPTDFLKIGQAKDKAHMGLRETHHNLNDEQYFDLVDRFYIAMEAEAKVWQNSRETQAHFVRWAKYQNIPELKKKRRTSEEIWKEVERNQNQDKK